MAYERIEKSAFASLELTERYCQTKRQGLVVVASVHEQPVPLFQ
jgi:hypothetical protein